MKYTLLMFLLISSLAAKQPTVTGNNLPEMVKDAVKVLNEMPSIRANFGSIKTTDIVVVKNIELFCREQKCSEVDKNKLKTAKAFTRVGEFPIYLVEERSDYNRFSLWEKEYSDMLEMGDLACKFPDSVYATASLIGHELVHKEGVEDETVAYLRQRNYNSYFAGKGCMESKEAKIFIASTIRDEANVTKK